jgi:hypothetical protein
MTDSQTFSLSLFCCPSSLAFSRSKLALTLHNAGTLIHLLRGQHWNIWYCQWSNLFPKENFFVVRFRKGLSKEIDANEEYKLRPYAAIKEKQEGQKK